MRVHDSCAGAAQLSLIIRHLGAQHRPLSKGGAGSGPTFVLRLLKIFEQDRLAVFAGSCLARRAIESQHIAMPHDTIVSRGGPERAGMQQHGILQPTAEFDQCSFRAVVRHGELHHGGGQARIFSIQRNERRISSQRHRDRRFRIAIFDGADRIFATKRDIGEPGLIEPPRIRFSADRRPQGKTLFQRQIRIRRTGIVAVARTDDLIEDVPMPERTVAAEIKLPGTNPPDRHADLGQFGTAINFARSASE